MLGTECVGTGPARLLDQSNCLHCTDEKCVRPVKCLQVSGMWQKLYTYNPDTSRCPHCSEGGRKTRERLWKSIFLSFPTVTSPINSQSAGGIQGRSTDVEIVLGKRPFGFKNPSSAAWSNFEQRTFDPFLQRTAPPGEAHTFPCSVGLVTSKPAVPRLHCPSQLPKNFVEKVLRSTCFF